MKKSFAKITIFIMSIIFSLGLVAGLKVSATSAFALTSDPDLYYSSENAPVIYGTSLVELSQNAVDSFSITDARFRTYARDFEDGDLALQVKDNTVVANQPGEYHVVYEATDSDGNKSQLEVPVKVNADTAKTIKVQRIMYMLPSDWNMDMVGTKRNNNGDRQNLGIFLPAGKSFKMRVLEGGFRTGVALLNNDAYKETSVNVEYNASGEYTTISNYYPTDNASKGQVPGYYDCVPLATTIKLARGQKINQTYKIEVEYNAEDVHELNYYYYGENEPAFKQKWRESGDMFAVLENEVMTLLVPIGDIDADTKFEFSSYDEHMEYYKKVVNRMDEIIGLSFNPEKSTDQNIRAKYLVKANAHGAGGAYYSGNHVGINNASMASFFEMNWGGLHEFAHGYQGSLGGGTMGLGEVSNNILGHYIQIDKNIFTANKDWLGVSSTVDKNGVSNEQKRNRQRLEGKTFTTLEGDEAVGVKLYALINLFDAFEGADTYAKMFQFYREGVNNGTLKTNMPNQDVYALFFFDEYDTSILPYFNQWGLEITTSVKDAIKGAQKSVSILEDSAGDKTDEVLEGTDTNLRFGLVTDEVLKQFGVKGNLTINIDIDNPDAVEGKVVQLLKANEVKLFASVHNHKAVFEGVDAGSYFVNLPILDGYVADFDCYTIEAGDNEQTAKYTPHSLTNFHSTKLRIRGVPFDTDAFTLTMLDQNTKGQIVLGAANLGNQGWTDSEQLCISVTIKRPSGDVVYQKEVRGKGYFALTSTTLPIIDLGYGCEIEVFTYYPQNIQVISMETGQKVEAYAYTAANKSTTITFTITRDGLVPSYIENFSAKDVLYAEVQEGYLADVEEMSEYFAEHSDVLDNKFLDQAKKQEFLEKFYKLSEQDKAGFSQLAARVQGGGKPSVTLKKDKLELKSMAEFEGLNFDEYLSAFDNEDRQMVLGSYNVTLITDANFKTAGTYDATLRVTDSDGNYQDVGIKLVVPNTTNYLMLALMVGGGVLLLGVVVLLMVGLRKKKRA